jgi:DNA-binding PadR family transcriptional regulator
MHGYEANLELERRHVREWAGISRPQVYYSLEKLAKLGLIRAADSVETAAGPERRVFETSARGKSTLADALQKKDWCLQRERPPFLTWMALSWQARPGVFAQQLKARRTFLRAELAREQETLKAILTETGHPFHEAVWMVKLVIQQFKAELRWLECLNREAGRRAPAHNPAYAGIAKP